MNYPMLSMDELMVELEANRLTRDEIQAEISERAKEELAEIEARKAELLALTEKPKAVAAPVVKTRKVGAPKYRDPAGNTWTGRGKKPAWMQAWIAKGKDPNELLIAA